MDDQGIGKHELKAIIRRAAELYAAETESDETLTEGEVMRIGEELGLPPRLVRQAIYELPEPEAPRTWKDRAYGGSTVSAARAVAGEAQPTLARLEDYLVTREYLQLRRKQPATAWFEPAHDPISSMARALSRPARRHHLARASRVIVTVRPLERGTSHVRILLDLDDRRRGAVLGGVLGGGALGVGVGTGAFILTGAALSGFVEPAGAFLGAAATGFGGLVATTGAMISVTARRFRNRLAQARIEVDGLLDRLERGDRLEPPPAPWWRRLQPHPPARRRS